MDRENMIQVLTDNNMIEILELIEDAERGHLHELELAPSLGLLRDEKLNKAVLDYLTENGVEIIYVDEEV
ncbi:hypothetical protein [Salipaludibacillus daqingensis]|uniref:hypothetical protein n=1 Tax=Salipaludibacillus daqingensis TaxID=3041001 RepID=UPI0024735C91|nr:hypothetical protein [Salipaludibacillus daqingensis]